MMQFSEHLYLEDILEIQSTQFGDFKGYKIYDGHGLLRTTVFPSIGSTYHTHTLDLTNDIEELESYGVCFMNGLYWSGNDIVKIRLFRDDTLDEVVAARAYRQFTSLKPVVERTPPHNWSTEGF